MSGRLHIFFIDATKIAAMDELHMKSEFALFPHGMEIRRCLYKVFLLEFKMATTDQLHIFCEGKNTQTNYGVG